MAPKSSRSIICPDCGGVLRPDAVLFGEMLPEEKIRRLHAEFYEDPPDLVLIAGTTAVFPYIMEPVIVAGRMARYTVEVNPEPTVVSGHVRWSLRGRAGDVLPRIAAAITSA